MKRNTEVLLKDNFFQSFVTKDIKGKVTHFHGDCEYFANDREVWVEFENGKKMWVLIDWLIVND